MILSNVNIGTGPSSGDGSPLRSAFSIINNNFQLITNNVNALTNSVSSVAGRTGNVILTVNDIVGLTPTNYPNATVIGSWITANVAALVDGAPDVLNTLNEIATAINDDANIATTLTNLITSSNLAMKGYVDNQTIQVVSGNIAFSNITITGNTSTGIDALKVGVPGIDPIPGAVASFHTDADESTFISVHNKNPGANVTSGFIATADQGDINNVHLLMGVTGGNLSGHPFLLPNEGTILASSANLVIGAGAYGDQRDIRFIANGSRQTFTISATTNSIELGSDMNLVFSGTSSVQGNLIPSANVIYSLGNVSHQWKDLWISNATIYLNSVPLSLGGDNTLLVNNVPVVTYVNGNLSVGGNVVNGGGASNTGDIQFVDDEIYTETGRMTFYNSGAIGPEINRIDFETDQFGVDVTTDINLYSSGNVTLVAGNGTNTTTWSFNRNGNLIFTDSTEQTTAWTGDITGNITVGNSAVNFVASSSGDGNGFSTIELHPDVNTSNQNYLIIDPTSPNHIHIRAGGTQDDSQAELYLGGESSYFKVNNGLNPDVSIAANNYVWSYGVDGNLTFPDSTAQSTAWTGEINNYVVGYRDVPQVAAGNVTLGLTDAGKHYYANAAYVTTLTIPSNANVAFPIGTAITVVNAGTGNVNLGKETEANLYLAGNSTNATRTLTSYGMATLLKTANDEWFVNGTGLV